MSEYVLGQHTYLCETEDGTVFLELSSRQYFAINEAQTRDLRRRVKGWPSQSYAMDLSADLQSCDSSVLKALVTVGVLSTSDRVPDRQFTYLAATSSFSRWQPKHIALKSRHLIRFIACLAYVAGMYKFGKLKYLVRRLEKVHARRVSVADLQPEPLCLMLNSFFQLRPWFYTAYNNCLFDSLMLSYFLARTDAPCKLVIGVSTKPFRADAWVQCGGLVVNSYVEDVQVYTPILTA